MKCPSAETPPLSPEAQALTSAFGIGDRDRGRPERTRPPPADDVVTLCLVCVP